MLTSLPVRLAALAALTLSLAACGTQGAPVSAALAAGKTMAAAKNKAGAKVIKSATVRVLESETISPVAADSATVNLEFDVRNEGASRGLMAAGDPAATIAADIDHVIFTLTGPSLATPLTATVSRAQFLNGKAVIQFNNLPAGDITITAVAKNAAGDTVVEANGNGAIRIGELTKVKLTCVVPPPTGTGHIRIEMDCFSDDCLPTPAPTPTSFVPAPVVDVNFHSIGDPHEDGANGLLFENQMTGTFLAMRTLTNDFALVKSQGPEATGRWPGATVNNAVAIQSNGDVFKWYLSGRRIFMNGAAVPATPGMTIRGAHGTMVTFVTMNANQAIADLVTPQGDRVRIDDRAHYLNVVGTISADRVVHEVRGSLGTFNNGTATQGMLMRNGSQAANLTAFLNDWKAQPSEDLFQGGPAITLTAGAI